MEKENSKIVWKKKCSEYQQCKKTILYLKEGINTTDDVWNKYVKCIEDLITSKKIKNQAAIIIENRIALLKKHWQEFKSAWEFKLPKSNPNVYDPFDPNPYQLYSVHKLLPKSMQKQKLDCFAKKLTELHLSVKEMAYPAWFDRLYQFIKTMLLKLYNCLCAGSGNLSGIDHYYIDVSQYEPASSFYVPTKYNYFICQEKLVHNAVVLKKDLAKIQDYQKAAQYDENIIRL